MSSRGDYYSINFQLSIAYIPAYRDFTPFKTFESLPIEVQGTDYLAYSTIILTTSSKNS